METTQQPPASTPISDFAEIRIARIVTTPAAGYDSGDFYAEHLVETRAGLWFSGSSGTRRFVPWHRVVMVAAVELQPVADDSKQPF